MDDIKETTPAADTTKLAINNNQISFRAYGEDLENIQKVYGAISEKHPGLNMAAFFKAVMKGVAEQLTSGAATLNILVAPDKGTDADIRKLQTRNQFLQGQLDAAKENRTQDESKLVHSLRVSLTTAEGEIKTLKEQASKGNNSSAEILQLQEDLAKANSTIDQLKRVSGSGSADTNWDELPFLKKLIRVKENMKASMKRNQEAGHSTDFESYVIFMYEFCKSRLSRKHF